MKKISKVQIEEFIDQLDFSKFGDLGELLPIVAQDYQSNEVLMLAYINKTALKKTLETGFAHYYSRSRQKVWQKGEESGHVQEVKGIFVDCDNDSLLMKVKQIGSACHKGYYSCFYTTFMNGELKIICEKIFNPKEVYKN